MALITVRYLWRICRQVMLHQIVDVAHHKRPGIALQRIDTL